MPKILSLDIGEKRIGVAICDTSLGMVFPREVIMREKVTDNKSENSRENSQEIGKTVESDISKILGIFKAEKCEKIIIGEPLGENNEPTERSLKIHAFADEMIRKNPDVVIEFVDESFSTKEALSKIPFKRDRKIKGAEDSLAAAIILERYLQTR